MRIDAVIFDHDGTLVDSEGIHFSIWQELLAQQGINFHREEYLNHHCGVPSKRNAELIVERHKLNTSSQQLLTNKQQKLDAWLHDHTFPLLPLAREALQECRKAQLKIGLATGAGRNEALRTVEGHNLAQYFDTLVTKDDVKNSKPAPETYLLAARHLAVEPEHCIAIEDSSTGVASAKAAGMQCITVKYELAKNQDLSSADYHCNDLLQAVDKALTLVNQGSENL
ncbi:haloacid dehalogenase superfamily, subfamily IA, variant 3 with third motif having DD or ED [Alteromonadaceae bacterium Bs31]|nr:haloacid dehalogenase superfamily, subfamily IA, variant 3 with third motif having DD or ED [Alteromonadaceae bacterium Bs31]